MSQDLSSTMEGRVETTLGELIEIVTQIALEAGRTEEEGYKLASLALSSILRRQEKNIDIPDLN